MNTTIVPVDDRDHDHDEPLRGGAWWWPSFKASIPTVASPPEPRRRYKRFAPETTEAAARACRHHARLDRETKHLISGYKLEGASHLPYMVVNYLLKTMHEPLATHDVASRFVPTDLVHVKQTAAKLAVICEKARDLNRALHRFPKLTSDLVVWRGLSVHDANHEKILLVLRYLRGRANADLHAAGRARRRRVTCSTFLSTSIDPKTAMHFARMRRGEKILIFWKITVPAGHVFPYVSQEMPVNKLHPCLNGEYEVLLPTNLVLALERFKKLRYGEPDYVALLGVRESHLPIYVYTLRVVGYEPTDGRFWAAFRSRSLQTLDKIRRYEDGEDVDGDGEGDDGRRTTARTPRPPNQHADEDAGVIVFHDKTPRTQIVNAHNLRGVVKVAAASVLRGARR
jgi:hypothetical protein